MTEPNDGSHPRAKNAPAYFVHENCRLFRRHPEIYFTGRVHELVEHRLTALGHNVSRAGFFIHHFGQLVEQEVRAQKAAAYLELLRLKVQEMPEDPLAWVQLGLQAYECSRDADEALRCFNRAIRLEPQASEAWVFKGMILLDEGECAEALKALESTAPTGPSRILQTQLRADALHNLGRLTEARAAYIRALKLTQDDPVILSKLGYTETKLGNPKQGVEKLKRAARADPESAEIRDRFMKACIFINCLPEAAEQAEELARIAPNPRAFLRAASIRVRLQQNEQANSVLARGLRMFPTSADLKRALSELA